MKKKKKWPKVLFIIVLVLVLLWGCVSLLGEEDYEDESSEQTYEQELEDENTSVVESDDQDSYVEEDSSAEETDNNKLYLLWSVTDIVLLSPAYIFVVNQFDSTDMWYWISILAISFIGGLIIGLIVSIAKRKSWFDLLERVDNNPTAWDKLFINIETDTLLFLELSDGRTILTKWNDRSFASYSGKDVFFSNYYVPSEKGTDEMVEKKGNHWNCINTGIWINCNNIVYLEVE